MSIFVYQSKECEREAVKHNAKLRLGTIKVRIEREQTIGNFDSIHYTCYYKKALTGNLRLLAHERRINDDRVLCFLGVCTRNSTTYDRFLDDEKFREKFSWKRVPDQEVRAAIDGTALPNGPVLQSPTAAEQSWLDSAFTKVGTSDHDLIIYESDYWVKRIKSPPYADSKESYYHLLCNFTPNSPTENELWNWPVGILYRYFPNMQRLFLLAPLHQRKSDDLDRLRLNFSDVLALQDSCTPAAKEQLDRLAYRAYTEWVLGDQAGWSLVETDDKSNLALSIKELEILMMIRKPQQQPELFPLFINGRAGTGKSTVLQYLMRDLLLHAFESNEHGLPIYLTCSELLCERAIDMMNRLLEKNHETMLASNGVSAQNLNQVLAHCFHPFYDYLVTLLPESQRSKFRSELKIKYSQFRTLWHAKFHHQNLRIYPCELAWHTLRTYIKGMRDEYGEYLTPELYREIGRKERTVTSQAFEWVYNIILTWYLPLCSSKGWWDEQDLVRQVLDQADFSDHELPRAVLCDEAQDFTRIELDLLYRLCLFSHRKLKPHQIRQVPIIFAGDPLQTINPTGFRWESTKALIREAIVAPFEPWDRKQIKLNCQELQENHRSTAPIVQFCNVILLMRAFLACKSDAATVLPQLPYRRTIRAPMPAYVSLDSPNCERFLHKSGIHIIINCEDGDESDYVKSDPALNSIYKDESGAPKGVFSPMKAKGDEYQEVVLYRFGHNVPPEVFELFQPATFHYDDDNHLGLEYFLNRLYVAASRARFRLYIIDAVEDIEKFWRPLAQHYSALKNYLRASDKAEWQKENLFCLPVDDAEVWSQEDAPDLEAMAISYRTRGRSERDPYFLRQARMLFGELGRRYEELECLAEALELEDALEEAGRTYLTIRKTDSAIDCFWRGKFFRHIHEDVTRAYPELAGMKSRASTFMVTKPSNKMVVDFTKRLAAYAPEMRKVFMSDVTWKMVVETTMERLVAIEATSLPPNTLRTVLAALKTISWCPGVTSKHLGELAYNARELQDAVDFWDKAEIKHHKYGEAKSILEPYPNDLYWLNFIGKHQQVITRWEKQPRPYRPENTVLSAVLNSYLKENKLEDALELVGRYRRKELFDLTWPEVMNQATAENDFLWRQAKMYADLLMNSGRWYEVPDFINLEPAKQTQPRPRIRARWEELTLPQYLETASDREVLTQRLKIHVLQTLSQNYDQFYNPQVKNYQQLHNRQAAFNDCLFKVLNSGIELLLINRNQPELIQHIANLLEKQLPKDTDPDQQSKWLLDCDIASEDGLKKRLEKLSAAGKLKAASHQTLLLDIVGALRTRLIVKVARSKKVREEHEQVKSKLSSYLRHALQPQPPAWTVPEMLPSALVGAAFENIESLDEALAFYHWLFHHGIKGERRYAVLRYSQCLSKQKNRELDSEKAKQLTQQIDELNAHVKITTSLELKFNDRYPDISETEALALRTNDDPIPDVLLQSTEIKISDSDLASPKDHQDDEVAAQETQPELSGSAQHLVSSQPLRWIVQDNELIFSVENTILRIHNQEELAWAELDLATNVMRGGGFKPQSPNLTWKSVGWDMTITLEPGDPTVLHLIFKGQERRLRFSPVKTPVIKS